MAKPKVELKCEKCGSKPPVFKEKSNENWTAYDTSKNCPCGGHYKFLLT